MRPDEHKRKSKETKKKKNPIIKEEREGSNDKKRGRGEGEQGTNPLICVGVVVVCRAVGPLLRP